MKTKFYLRHSLVFTMLLSVNFIFAQSVMFAKKYGGSGYDYGYSVKQTFDNGYIIAGSTTSYGSGGSDAYLVKIDSNGYQMWNQLFGGINIDKGFSIKETNDSGLVIAGYTNSFGNGGYDMYVIRTNKMGDTLWTKTYGGADWDFGFSIDITSDGGYIVAGGTYSSGNGNEDMYLVKLNSNGDTLWTKTYGGTNEDEAKSVKQTSDGGYILAGYTKSYGDINGDIYIVKTTLTGDTSWTKKIGGLNADEAADIIEAANGEFVLVGGTKSLGVGGYDCQIARLSITGNILWSQTYGTLNYNYATSVVETNTGNLVFSNTTEDSGAGLRDGNIFFANMAGGFVDTRTYGSAFNEEVFSIAKCRDKGFIICGYTEGYSSVFSDMYVVKTDSLGNSAPFTTSVFSIENTINQLKVYPNPSKSSSLISITLPDNIKTSDNYTIILTDIRGSEIKRYDLSPIDQSVFLSINDIEDGTYIINIIDKGIVVGHAKLVYIK